MPAINRFVAVTCIAVVGATAVAVAGDTKPYSNRIQVIPGKIEAEHFDLGPPGEAYYDVDEQNQGADYREPTQVDIEQRDDASNGHGIGWTRKGEWLVYSVDVEDAGEFILEIPVASNKTGGVFHIEFDGNDVSGPIHVPDTGGWKTLNTIYVENVQLKAGKQQMKLVMDKVGESGSIGDIDFVHFRRATTDNQLTAAERKKGWKLLFNGRDHTNWKCNNGKPVATAVENGSIVPYKSGGYLVVYDQPFGDFILKCDVRWEAARCNSGIFLRVGDLTNPVHTGFEIQVMSGNGTTKHDFGAIYDLVAPAENRGKPTGGWNAVEVKCQGAEITVSVNGKQVAHIDCDKFDEPGLCPDGQRHKFKLDGKPQAVKDFARKGYLGFQDHGQKVWYKNVKLLPLSTQ